MLVECPLARRATHLLGLSRVVEELRVRVVAWSAFSTTISSRPGSNQRSIPSCGLETIVAPDIASSNGRDVEDAWTDAWARRVTFRLIRAAEMAREKTLKGTSPASRARPMSPRKSRPPREKSASRRRLGSPIIAAVHSWRNLSP